MFSVGQTVYHKTKKHSGTVLECDGVVVYLTSANGVELEFEPPAAICIAKPGRFCG